MIRLTIRFILFGILSFLLFVPPADAAVPVPSEITADIIEHEQTELSVQRAELLVRRDAIKLSVAIHNAKCSNVAPGSSIVNECRTSQGKLQADIIEYAAAVHAFNSIVLEAPRVLDELEPTAALQEYETEHLAQQKALNEIRSTVEEMLNE